MYKYNLRIPKIDIVTILLACYFTNIFYFKGIEMPHKVIIWIITAFYILFNFNGCIKIISPFFLSTKGKWFCSILIVWLIILVSTPILSGSMDFSILEKLLTGISFTLYMLVLAIRLKKKHPSESLFRNFVYTYVYALVAYVLFTIVCVIIPPIYSIILEVVSTSEDSFNFIEDARYATRVGWIGFSGFSVAVKCVIANLFILNEISLHHINKIKCPLKKYILYLITLIGTLFYARTGFVICMFCLFFLALYYCKRGQSGKSIKLILLMGVIGVATFFVIISTADNNVFISWAFEMLLNVVSGNGFSSVSTDILLRSMLIMPDESTLIWGDGFYTSAYGGYYMGSDIGLIRQVFYYGIVGIIFAYLLVLRSLSGVKDTIKGGWNLLYYILVIEFLVFECKGEPMVLLLPVFICISICNSFDKKYFRS